MDDIITTIYTIYDSPSDYPGRFVVREWQIVRYMTEPMPGNAQDFSTLTDARVSLRKGLHYLPRQAADDPTIVESWI